MVCQEVNLMLAHGWRVLGGDVEELLQRHGLSTCDGKLFGCHCVPPSHKNATILQATNNHESLQHENALNQIVAFPQTTPAGQLHVQ